jgi:hypothetical protein
MLSAVAEITQKYCAHTESVRRGDPSLKQPSLIRAADFFRPFHVIMGVELVRKHEMGLECDQRLSRKLKIKVATAVCTWHRTSCSVPQFSRQALIHFESCFVFSDQVNTHDHLRLLKAFRCANQRQRSSGCSSSRNDAK